MDLELFLGALRPDDISPIFLVIPPIRDSDHSLVLLLYHLLRFFITTHLWVKLQSTMGGAALVLRLVMHDGL